MSSALSPHHASGLHQFIDIHKMSMPHYLMNETRRKPTTRRQSPSLFDKWHGIFYIPSRIDEAGHTKAFDYPVAEHWGGRRNVQFRGWDSNRQHIGPQSNALPTEPPQFLLRLSPNRPTCTSKIIRCFNRELFPEGCKM